MSDKLVHNRKIMPIILSGGIGSRLWPMSRESYPKQFLKLSSQNLSLIQKTAIRTICCDVFEPPIIVSNYTHRFLVAEQMRSINVMPSAIILEPFSRDTAPAIASAALYIQENFDNALMLILPSDHIIESDVAFLQCIKSSKELASKGNLVTFGVNPEYPEAGYGYIKCGKKINESAYVVDEFVEKPNIKTAEEYIASEEYVWNSGIFMFTANDFLAELKMFHHKIYESCKVAFQENVEDKDFIRLNKEAFKEIFSISVDCAVMEKTKKTVVVPLPECGWNDAGSWESLYVSAEKDNNGNVSSKGSYIVDVKNCYISSDDDSTIAAIGLDSIVIISTKDGILVADKSRTQDVKLLVDVMKKDNERLVAEHTKVFRPWGYYDVISIGEKYKVKLVNIAPEGKLSLQIHHHRAEHWVVVSGTANITIGDKEKKIVENESIYISRNTKHSIENAGKVDLIIIEVQTGSYLTEEDIVRYDDKYGRI